MHGANIKNISYTTTAGGTQGEREAWLQAGQPKNRSSILGEGKTVFRNQKSQERL